MTEPNDLRAFLEAWSGPVIIGGPVPWSDSCPLCGGIVFTDPEVVEGVRREYHEAIAPLLVEAVEAAVTAALRALEVHPEGEGVVMRGENCQAVAHAAFRNVLTQAKPEGREK